jgi:hypothetical protein
VSRLKLYVDAKRESSMAYHATGGAYRMEVRPLGAHRDGLVSQFLGSALLASPSSII